MNDITTIDTNNYAEMAKAMGWQISCAEEAGCSLHV